MNNITRTQLKMIAHLIDNQDKLLGIRELSKQISVAYYLVHKNIQQLYSKKIINIKKAGKTNIISINPDADRAYLIAAERFKKDLFFRRYPEIKVTLKKIIDSTQTKFFILMVFGSYTSQPRKGSDLDVLIIVPDDSHTKIIEKAINSTARTSTIEIHETIVTEEAYVSMINKKAMNVASEAKKNHILIYGDDLYYKDD